LATLANHPYITKVMPHRPLTALKLHQPDHLALGYRHRRRKEPKGLPDAKRRKSRAVSSDWKDQRQPERRVQSGAHRDGPAHTRMSDNRRQQDKEEPVRQPGWTKVPSNVAPCQPMIVGSAVASQSQKKAAPCPCSLSR
jgi:hypothetical protein